MAQRVITQLVDDLDGSELAQGDGRTVRFDYEGTSYEIDLSNRNAEKLEKALQPYIDVARKVSKSGGRRRSSGGAKDYVAAEVRAWAQSNGIDVPERGRIPAEILEQYRSAN